MPPKRVLMPLPSKGFDPTETGAPWSVLVEAGVKVVFATPRGREGDPPEADPFMLEPGRNALGPFGPLLIADEHGREAYDRMTTYEVDGVRPFQSPISYDEIDPGSFDGLVLPGGHAPGIKEYLESEKLRTKVVPFFTARKPIGAICHGVVLAARCQHGGRSVLDGYHTTALTRRMEEFACTLTENHVPPGYSYRTYPETSVQDEVTAALGANGRFEAGPQLPDALALPAAPNIAALFANNPFLDLFKTGFLRDGPTSEEPAFTVCHGDHYLSARWPGDAFTFAKRFLVLLEERRCRPEWTNSGH